MESLAYLGELLNEVLHVNQDLFTISLFGFDIAIPETLISMWVAMAILIVAALWFTRKLTTIPGRRQAAIETVVEFTNKIVVNNVGHHGKQFASYFGTLFLFIFLANGLTMFNFIPPASFFADKFGWEFMRVIPDFAIKAPTKDINMPLSLAIMSMGFLVYSTIKVRKTHGFLKTFITPSPVMVPFKILDYVIRTLSLTLRLFGNVLAAVIIMEIIELAVPYVLPAFASMYFDIIDGALQAYIFVFLTMLYTSENLEEEA